MITDDTDSTSLVNSDTVYIDYRRTVAASYNILFFKFGQSKDSPSESTESFIEEMKNILSRGSVRLVCMHCKSAYQNIPDLLPQKFEDARIAWEELNKAAHEWPSINMVFLKRVTFKTLESFHHILSFDAKIETIRMICRLDIPEESIVMDPTTCLLPNIRSLEMLIAGPCELIWITAWLGNFKAGHKPLITLWIWDGYSIENRLGEEFLEACSKKEVTVERRRVPDL